MNTKERSFHDLNLNKYSLYLFTFFYIAVEFGFNYQLLNLTVDFASEDVLLGLEFWGRVISGIGMSLILYRLSARLNLLNGLRYFLCLILGITLMWNVQKTLTDYLVEQASAEDKKISFLLSALSSKAAEGALLTLNGNQLVSKQLSEQDRKITASLFPAMALYAPHRNAQIAAWSAKTPDEIESLLAINYSESVLSNAYRNLIIPPLTLGISIFFALLNLAQWVGMTMRLFENRWAISQRLTSWVTGVTFITLLCFSLLVESPLVDSRAYQQEFKKPLFENDYFLAVITTISARAVPHWYFLSKTCNQYVLGGVELKRPY